MLARSFAPFLARETICSLAVLAHFVASGNAIVSGKAGQYPIVCQARAAQRDLTDQGLCPLGLGCFHGMDHISGSDAQALFAADVALTILQISRPRVV